MIQGRNLLEVYPQLLNEIRNNSLEAAPRGQRVTEHNGPIAWKIEKPWEWALLIPGRRINPFFALAEVVWMWSGKGGIDFISYYNKSMTQFADDNIPYFNAAYGRRARHAGYDERPFREIPYLTTPNIATEKVDVDQIQFVIKKLKADPETRQAAISLWDPVKDNFTKSKDHPCNNMIYVSQRGFVTGDKDKGIPATSGKLNMTVVIRSNDLIWGIPYNMIQFVHLQALIAGSLGYEMGTFTVMCNNLHYYHDLYPETLVTVLGWNHNLSERQVELDGTVHDAAFANWDSKLMLWDIDRFDGFVRNIWDALEKELRWGFEQGAKPVWYHTRWLKLNDMLTINNVPVYWQMVFSMMFLFHVRKAKANDVASDIVAKMPLAMRWLIEDFNRKADKESNVQA